VLLARDAGRHVCHGYHGTTERAWKRIQEEGFNESEYTWHWLGRGIYFWQDAPLRALEWAMEQAQKGRSMPVVVRADIDLSDCMDLLDIRYFQHLKLVKQRHERLKKAVRWRRWWTLIRGSFGSKKQEAEPARQKALRITANAPVVQGEPHPEDHEMFERALQRLREKGEIYRSVRAAFIEGEPIYPRSHIYDRAHVQICVRDLSALRTPPRAFIAKAHA
jgi:hypothetical protein